MGLVEAIEDNVGIPSSDMGLVQSIEDNFGIPSSDMGLVQAIEDNFGIPSSDMGLVQSIEDNFGIRSSDMELVQAIEDNFDANITSPNGLKVNPCFGTTDDRYSMSKLWRKSGRHDNQKTQEGGCQGTWYTGLRIPWPHLVNWSH